MTVAEFLCFLSAIRSLLNKLSLVNLILLGFNMSFLMLERKSYSSGYLDNGGFQFLLPGTCGKCDFSWPSSGSSGFSRKNTAVRRRASKLLSHHGQVANSHL